MKRLLALFLVFGVGLGACSPATTEPVPQATFGIPVPYQTKTPKPTPTSPIERVEPALPTPTPFIYKVQQGDTMLGIAMQFGISLENLMAANPGVNPSAMSVGTELRIPSGPDDLSGEPTPTPVPLTLSSVDCYPGIDKSMWCFALVRNDYSAYVENVSAQVSLFNPQGALITSEVAMPLLNVIPPGEWLPLVAFFPPTVPPEAAPRLTWLTAVQLLKGDVRYLPASANNVLVVIDKSGRFAWVNGEVRLAENSQPAQQVWVAATAYDAEGSVVGVRRWEAELEVLSEERIPFEMQVSSLGELIEYVEVVIEVRP